MDIELDQQNKHDEMVEVSLDPIVVPPNLYDDDDQNEETLEIVTSGKSIDTDCVPEDLLKTDITKGLTQQQVEQRTKKFGKNQLPEEKQTISKHSWHILPHRSNWLLNLQQFCVWVYRIGLMQELLLPFFCLMHSLVFSRNFKQVG